MYFDNDNSNKSECKFTYSPLIKNIDLQSNSGNFWNKTFGDDFFNSNFCLNDYSNFNMANLSTQRKKSNIHPKTNSLPTKQTKQEELVTNFKDCIKTDSNEPKNFE
jgi:hypothetical protein